MIIDALKNNNTKLPVYDICIVGAGAAGITLALELANTSNRVIILESGGHTQKSNIQSLSKGSICGQSYHVPLHLTQPRVLGGATTVWGGRCVPLSGIDFDRRNYIPHSGWPFSLENLRPFYERANALCEVGGFEYDASRVEQKAARAMIPGFDSEIVSTDKIERFSTPTNFWERYRKTLEDAPNIDLIYNATCVDIELHSSANYVSNIYLSTITGSRFSVRSKKYILATGCLETTRLLLASNSVLKNGIGNHSDSLGRYYMSHIEGTVGEITFAPNDADIIFGYEQTPEGVYFRRRLSIKENKQRQYRIGNFVARLHRPMLINPQHKNAVLSAAFLLKEVLLPARLTFTNNMERKQIELAKYKNQRLLFPHIRNILFDMPRLAAFSKIWVQKRILAKRKLPPMVFKSHNSSYPLEINAEQSPDSSNRVTITNDRDRLGLPRLYVKWKINNIDQHTIKTSLNLIKEELHNTGCGLLGFRNGSVEEQIENCTPIAGHHMGTTRMALSPSEGVVDENCRIHGISNLYVSGSSTFPTSGHANPTLTIVAMAIRLADYLKTKKD